MKTQNYIALAAALIIGCTSANARSQGSIEQRMSDCSDIQPFATYPNSMAGKDVANTGAKKDSHETDKTSQLLQDMHFYSLCGNEQMLLGYVSEPAASAIGYMGFKVGDKVKWGSAVDAKMIKLYGHDGYITGTVNMLDSDRCFIVIDSVDVVAVKPYEDIEKVNP